MNTRAAFIGIGYQLWRRTRWMLLATAGQVISLVAAVHVLRSPESSPLVGVLFLSLVGITVPFFIQAFTYGGDLSSTDSGFPRHMMVLPLSASALALTPMLYGVGFMAALWVVVGKFAIAPLGLPAPGVCSALVPTALVAWLCATAWTPFWFPFARVIACVGMLSAIVAFTIATRLYLVPQWMTVTALLIAIALAFATAVGGVARARRGDGTVSPWTAHRSTGTKSAPLLKPFRSAEHAQIWFELRRNCTLGGLFVLGMIVLGLPLLFGSNQHIDVVDFYIVPVPFLPTAIFLLGPIFIFTITGGNFAKPDAWSANMMARAFFTARPTNDRFLISAKMKAAALTGLIVWAIVLSLVGLRMLIPNGDRQAESLAHFLSRHATPRHALLAIAALAGLILLSWIAVIKTFALNLYGRNWIPSVSVLGMILLFSVVPGLGIWAWRNPEVRASVISAAPIIMGLLIAAKVGLALPIIRALRRCHIATDARLRNWTAAWFLAVATLLGITFCLVPAAWHWGPAIVAAVVLILPYNRMIAMPLAWHYNRHR